jgi:hypothetical protein
MTRLGQAALCAALIGAAQPALAQSAEPSTRTASAVAPFTADDLLFMEARVGDQVICDAINIYGARGGVFVPLGELARVLDFPLGVFPANGRAEGQGGAPLRDIELDVSRGFARTGELELELSPGQAVPYDGDIYVRLDLAELLLGLTLRADVNAQALEIASDNPLPFQAAAARAARARALGAPSSPAAVSDITPPYALFTAPAVDVQLGGAMARSGEDYTRSFNLRSAGDLGYGTVQTFLGSDERGQAQDARVTWERKDDDGRALGRLGGTRAGFGDVYTAPMALGASGRTGRGAFYSSAPLEVADLSTPLDLRGELALGEEVELYVNEVLQAVRWSGDAGRYVFPDVPLAYGLNVVRLVFYGSRGQVREEVRRITIGAGQLPAGQMRLRLGAVQDETPLIDLGGAPSGRGDIRLSAIADVGLTATQTLSLGAARYAPDDGASRMMGVIGLRSALGPAAVQVDAAFDDQGGRGLLFGVAARPGGVSVVARHSEYAGGFIDETRTASAVDGGDLIRATDVRIDASLPSPIGALPLSVDVDRRERSNGEWLASAAARTSLRLDRYYLSAGLNWEGGPASGSDDRLSGAFDVSTLAADVLHLRAGLHYRLDGDARVEAAFADVDYVLSPRDSLRFGALRTMGPAGSDVYQVAALRTDPRFDLSLRASWEPGRDDLRVGMQIGFGLFFDPNQRRYRPVRSGVTTGGAVLVSAFRDDDGDGVRSASEAPVAGLELQTPRGPVRTDADGQATGVGLGDGGAITLRADMSAVEDPFLALPTQALAAVPRPGRTITVPVPLQSTGEVEVVVELERDGQERPLAAVDVILTRQEGGEPVRGRSDFAGVVTVAGLRPGSWTIRLNPTQALNLGLVLDEPVQVTVPPDGGFIRGEPLRVRIERRTST